MRNERRIRNPKEGGDLRKKAYIAGSIISIAIIVFVITFIVYGNKMQEETRLGRMNTITNNYIENTTIEETSSQFGKTVNEMENEEAEESSTEMVNDTTKYAVNTSKVEENKMQDEIKQSTNTSEKSDSKETNKVKEDKEKEETKTEDPKFIMPVKGEINKEYAKDKLVYSDTLGEWVTHNGIDIKAEKTTVVKASAEGTVKSIKNDPRYGLTVVIEHNNGFKTVYSNLLTAEFVVVGEKVKQDQTIGTVGNTATFEITDEPHLHFEILKDSNYLDPELYLAQ